MGLDFGLLIKQNILQNLQLTLGLQGFQKNETRQQN